MVTARTAHKALLAIATLTAALVFPLDTWAAAGNGATCQPNSTCTVGEFLYNDSYQPITAGATCTITSRYPDGTLFLNSTPATVASDGWYSYSFTAPSTTGAYRSQICCTVSGSLMCLDKSFEVKAQTSLTQGDVTNAVWNANRSSYKASGSFGEVLQNAIPAASDIASATWSYSTRTAEGFWNLVNDIMGNSSSSQQTPLSKDISSIKTSLDKNVNQPIIQNALEQDKTPNLQSKIDETKTRSDKIFAKQQYIRSKVGFIQTKWNSLSEKDISVRLDELTGILGRVDDPSFGNTIFSQVNWLKESWNWKTAERTYSQTKDVSSNISAVKSGLNSFGVSDKTNTDVKNLIFSLDKLDQMQTPLFADIQHVRELAFGLDAKSTDISNILASWNSKKDVSQKVNELSKEVETLNNLPKATFFFSTIDSTSSEKVIKNKLLDLRGIIEANVKLLARKAGNSLSTTWLNSGSIIFKTLVTNPSQITTQTIPVKIYFPSEVKKENIISIDDGLTISYDSEKNQYYYQGSFIVRPGETKTLQVRVDDNIFVITDNTIASLRKQAEELSKPLNNTSYFAQGVTLKSSIDVSLDKIVELQKNAITPDEKIRAYREAKIELDSAKTTMTKLQELASTAGSTNNLFGFVGGTQTLAVWGLIIIMAAGFIFLALYMREIRRSEKFSKEAPQQKNNRKGKKETPMPLRQPRRRSMLNTIIFLLIYGSVVAVASGFTVSRIMGSSKLTAVPPPVAQKITGEKQVLGTSKNPPANDKFKLVVPLNNSVNIYKEPSLDSQIVTSFKESQDVKKLAEHNQWVKIAIEGLGKDKTIEGWIDKDFIQAPSDNATGSARLTTNGGN